MLSCRDVFDAVVCFEEKVMEQVIAGETAAARRLLHLQHTQHNKLKRLGRCFTMSRSHGHAHAPPTNRTRACVLRSAHVLRKCSK